MGIYEELKGLETDDFQNRSGAYPKSGIPDSIIVFKKNDKLAVRIDFKNTSEYKARNWYNKNVEIHSSKILNMTIEQTGDYWDDWVTLEVIYKGDE